MLHTKLYLNILIFTLLIFSSLYADPIRIMPLGDSITYDNTHADDDNPRPKSQRSGYRNYLWYMLKDTNMSVDFVGPRQAGQAIKPPFDVDNAGYPGETSHQIADKTYHLMEDYNPNIVLLHIGTNDHSKDVSGVNDILNWIDTYENDTNTKIRVIVAFILDRKIPDRYIEGFNHNLEKLLKKRWENGDMLTWVDMYRGAGLTDADYTDRTHPNSQGYKKMAKVWFKAITTPYVAYTSAPVAKDDKVSIETGSSVSINVTLNDTDDQNDMNRSSVNFVGGNDSDGDGDNDILTVSGEGKWSVDEHGTVSFIPENGFTADPTPVQYTVKDDEGKSSKPAKIIIDYSNKSLESYPTTLVNEAYIESKSIDESTNTITFITRVPSSGIKF